jgi:hypothetical protein
LREAPKQRISIPGWQQYIPRSYFEADMQHFSSLIKENVRSSEVQRDMWLKQAQVQTLSCNSPIWSYMVTRHVIRLLTQNVLVCRTWEEGVIIPTLAFSIQEMHQK